MKKIFSLVLLALSLSASLFAANVPTNSPVVGITLTQDINSSLTVSATPSTLTLAGATPSAPITITTTYNLLTASTLDVYAGFTTIAAMTESVTGNAFSGALFTGNSNGAGDVAFAGPPANGLNKYVTVAHATGLIGSGSRPADTLTLAIPSYSTLVAGNYTGTLNILAITQ